MVQATSNIYGMLVALFICLAWCPADAASTDEIQVYTDSINKPGIVGLELHTNFVLEGNPLPAYQGDIPSQHLFRITPEFSYGLSRSLEAGLYLPAAIAGNGSSYFDGWRVRMKYIPSLTDGTFFAGLNCEYGRVSRRLEESHWNLELRPIVGFRSTPWLIAFNPVLGWRLSNGGSSTPAFTPELKVQYSITEGVGIGIEHYADLGAINHILPLHEQGQVIFAALDISKGPLPVNIGVGRSLTPASDEWVIKAIFSMPLSTWLQ